MSSRPFIEVSRKLGNFKYFGRFLSAGVDLVFPPLCVACEETQGPWVLSTLCRKCFVAVLEPTRLSLPGLEGVFALAAAKYKGVLKKWIPQAKFHSDPAALRAIEEVVAQAAMTSLPEIPELVTYIPGHPDHLRERGVSVPRWLARRVSKALHISLAHGLLRRNRIPLAQTALSRRERLENMEGLFQVKEKSLPESVLLIDDVVTTGATLASAVNAFREAGVDRLFVLVAAHTPLTVNKGDPTTV